MGGSVQWRIPIEAEDWVNNVEKRIMHSERRPTVRTAADLLGPGIAPFAVEISDWNDEVTAFNGFWWSQPGAINSPDPTNNKWYMGRSEATEDGFGLQWATEFNNIAGDYWPPDTYIRRFFDPGSAGTTSYSAWKIDSGASLGLVASFTRASDGVAFVTATLSPIIWSVTTEDRYGFASLPDTDIVVPVGMDGSYLITASMVWDANATGNRNMRIYVNGALRASQSLTPGANNANGAMNNVSKQLRLVAGDVITVQVFQNSGVNLAGSGGGFGWYPTIELSRLSA